MSTLSNRTRLAAAESVVFDPEVTGHGTETGEACLGGHMWEQRHIKLRVLCSSTYTARLYDLGGRVDRYHRGLLHIPFALQH